MHKTSLYTHIEIIKTAPLVVEQIILHRQGTADEYRLEITAPLVVEQIRIYRTVEGKYLTVSK